MIFYSAVQGQPAGGRVARFVVFRLIWQAERKIRWRSGERVGGERGGRGMGGGCRRGRKESRILN